MVWPPICSVFLTFAGCPLQLYLLNACYVLLLVPTGKALELGFPKAFNKSLIKCGKIVSCLMQYSRKIWEMNRNVSAHPAQLLNPTISKFCHFSDMVITLCNLDISLSLLLLSHPTISKFYQPINWIFFRLVIPLNFFWR